MGMFDVSEKPDTLRQAWAQAIVNVNPETIKLILEGKSPKGDIIEAARYAGTMVAKHTADIIPYCHPIPIDYIKIDVALKEASIIVDTEVKTVWKTGVEMEAMAAASVAALTIYDMLKPVDEELSIGSVKLLGKSGGLKSFATKYDRTLKAAVVVVSDSTSRGERDDRSGKLAIDKLKSYGFSVDDYIVVPDEADLIEITLKCLCDESKMDLVVTSGGTGLGPRDVTVDATMKVLEKEIKGVSEVIRAYGQRRTPFAMLSRGVCGVRGKSVVVNLPGSAKGVAESLSALLPGVLHVYGMIEGGGH